jgi:hypothetical protein
MSIATISPSRVTSKPHSHGEWCRRESFRQALRDVRATATKAAERLYDCQFRVAVQELAEGPQIIVYVQDRTTAKNYRIPIPEGLVRFDVARLLIAEIRDHRQRAGAESWKLCLPGPWLLV